MKTKARISQYFNSDINEFEYTLLCEFNSIGSYSILFNTDIISLCENFELSYNVAYSIKEELDLEEEIPANVLIDKPDLDSLTNFNIWFIIDFEIKEKVSGGYIAECKSIQDNVSFNVHASDIKELIIKMVAYYKDHLDS